MITGGKFLLFRVGQIVVDNQLLPYDFYPMMQSGTITLITDDTFERRPASALEAVRSVLNKRKSGSTWRIVGRPGLLTWLLELNRRADDTSV